MKKAQQALDSALGNVGNHDRASMWALISIAQSLIDIRDELGSIEQNTRPRE